MKLSPITLFLIFIILNSGICFSSPFYDVQLNADSAALTGKYFRLTYEAKLDEKLIKKIDLAEFDSCSFIDMNFDNGQISNSYLKNCKITNRELINNLTISNTLFQNSRLDEFSLNNGNINSVEFKDCIIKEIDFKKCRIKDLVFKDCTIDRINIQNSDGIKINFMGGIINEINIWGSDLGSLELSKLKFNTILFQAGTAQDLCLYDLNSSNGKIMIIGTLLNYPKLSLNIFKYLDLTRANILIDDFIIAQEKIGDLLESNSKKYDYYKEARVIYSLLGQQFHNANMKKHERIMEYRMRVVERKTNESAAEQFIEYVLEDQIRGHYGLDPSVVIFSAFIIWMFFAVIYFFLGVLHFGWGMELTINTLGEKYSNTEAVFIVPSLDGSVIAYVITCLAFSFDQLISLGLKAFEISSYSSHLRKIPKIYIAVGFGKVVSLVQNILGLVLLFFFIQAFIRTL